MEFLFENQEPSLVQFTEAILKFKPIKIYDKVEGTLPLVEFHYIGDNLCVCTTKQDFPMLAKKRTKNYKALYQELKGVLGDLNKIRFVK